MRPWLKSALLILHLLAGLLLGTLVLLDWGRRLPRERMAQGWHRRLLRILGIRLRVTGIPFGGPRVTVANHVSWLDIPVIGAVEPTRFISKSEVRHWPIAGWLADAAGTFYIRRGKGGAGPLLARLIPHLQDNGSVVFFPEGTTTDGTVVQKFHPRLFDAAIEAGCPVQPVALRYGRGHDDRQVAPFIGDDTLAAHVLRVLQEPELVVEVAYCPPLSAAAMSRTALAQAAEDSVRTVISAGGPVEAVYEALPVEGSLEEEGDGQLAVL